MQLALFEPRAYHESAAHQKELLHKMRQGVRLRKQEQEFNGRRIAPAIDKLRNAWGFLIEGDGSWDNPYYMQDTNQKPKKYKVCDDLKRAYYDSRHWSCVYDKRLKFDDFRCVICKSKSGILQCHHITYERLFFEIIETDLMTVCRECHECIHENSRLAWPSGMLVEHVNRLVGDVAFPSWVMP